jgi:hypothetical protein
MQIQATNFASPAYSARLITTSNCRRLVVQTISIFGIWWVQELAKNYYCPNNCNSLSCCCLYIPACPTPRMPPGISQTTGEILHDSI